MRTPVILIAAMVTWVSPALAVTEPADNPALSDDRIKTLPYDENDVYTILTKYGYQTNVVFAKNEEIVTISVGDRSLWQIIPSGNRMFIRPLQSGVTTNMTVLTNKRSYQFDLKSADMNDSDAQNIYVAKFSYPSERRMDPPPPPVEHASLPPHMPPPPPPHMMPPPPVAETLPPPQPIISAPLTTPVPDPNYNYTYSGPDRLAPLQVFDNGSETFIRYHTLPMPTPEVYLVDAFGSELRVTPQVQDNMLVVSAIAGKMALKQGDGTITVYNEQLNPQ